MFKSTRDCDVAICTLLKGLIDNNQFAYNPEEIKNDELSVAMDYIERNRLAIGFAGRWDERGSYGIERKSPFRITREGLAFVENFNAETLAP